MLSRPAPAPPRALPFFPLLPHLLLLPFAALLALVSARWSPLLALDRS
ncbi:membrane protein, partial [Streptomyces rimosus subsp. rimosus]